MSAQPSALRAPVAWTPQADQIIRRNYGRIPSRRIGAALGRTGRQVAGRARALGLVAPVVWSERETALIRKHYRSGDGAATAALVAVLGKPVHQVRHKAKALGLTRTKERRWTKEDDYRLSISWGRISDAAVARKLGRTVDACKIRATRVLHKSRKDGLRGWTALGLARLFRVDQHKVTDQWVAKGWLTATETTIGAGANKTLLIEEAALLAFLRAYPHEYQWRRMDDPSGYYRRIAQEASAGLLTTAEVAARYGMSRNGATAWIAKGWLPAVRGHTNGNAGVWMVREADLAGWTPPRPELIGRRERGLRGGKGRPR